MLLVVLIIFFVMYLTFPRGEKATKPCVGPHDWQYKKQPDNPEIEYLQCVRCNKYPGAEASDE
jgi:hypothetical protein